jgi:hypothetical protein
MDLLLNRADIHHVYPKKFLKDQGLSKSVYNQIGNYVIAQSEINISIGAKDPSIYFKEIKTQCENGNGRYGGITNNEELLNNFKMNCIPLSMLNEITPTFDEFLNERRELMSLKIKEWFEKL